MTVASVPGVASPTLPTAVPAAGASSSGSTASGSVTSSDAPTDTVTLSPAAQQALSAQAPAATAAPASADAAVDQAIVALNDTSGQTSTADQLQAYALLANFVAKGQPATAADQQASSDATAALYNSPFAQHAQQLLDTLGGEFNWSGGAATANSIDNVLATLNALSPTDQQIYVGATAVQSQLLGATTPITTVADYQANLQARADVERSIQAAVSNPAYASSISQGVEQGVYGERDRLGPVAAAAGDQATAALVKLSQTTSSTAAWTQQVQAYFAQYGPPPAAATTAGASSGASSNPLSNGYRSPGGSALTAALAAVNDTSGKTTFADQISSFQTLMNYMTGGVDYGPARTAVEESFTSSALFKQANQAAEQFNAEGMAIAHAADDDNADINPSQSQLALLNKLSPQQQQLVFVATAPSFSSLDAWKGQLAQNQAVMTAQYDADNAKSAQAKSAAAAKTVSGVASAGSPSTAQRALAILTSPKSTDSNSDVALTLLQNAAEAAAKKAQAANDGANSRTEPAASAATSAGVLTGYKAGSALSVTA